MAVKASREFQIFAKPVGAICNLDCHYCYYLQKELLYPQTQSFHMPDDLLEEYIVQQIEITPESVINFFWHVSQPSRRKPWARMPHGKESYNSRWT